MVIVRRKFRCVDAASSEETFDGCFRRWGRLLSSVSIDAVVVCFSGLKLFLAASAGDFAFSGLCGAIAAVGDSAKI